MLNRPDEIYDLIHFSKEAPLSSLEEMIYESIVRQKIKEKRTLSDFRGLSGYSDIEIINDERRAKELKEKFVKEPTLRSEILEAILKEQIEMNEWLGDEIHTASTPDFDDFFNHTDFVLEVSAEDGENFCVSIDATVGDNKGKIGDKFKKIKNELDRGRGTTVKYFQSEIDPELSGPQYDLPGFVIAMDTETLRELCGMVSNTIGDKKIPGAKQKMAKSSLQLSLLNSMLAQAEVQADYLETNKKTKTVIFERLVKLHAKLLDVLENKKGQCDDKDQHLALSVLSLEDYFK